jgi:hypothetical protein
VLFPARNREFYPPHANIYCEAKMNNKKLFSITLICSVSILSGCLSREVQEALAHQLATPYGLSSIAAAQYGAPMRGYSSVDNSIDNQYPQRGYSSRAQMMAGGMGFQGSNMACFQNIDQAELNRFSETARLAHEDIKQLCAQGMRDKAMKRAIALGRQLAQNKTLRELKKCGAAARNMAPAIVHRDPASKHHVCDE